MSRLLRAGHGKALRHKKYAKLSRHDALLLTLYTANAKHGDVIRVPLSTGDVCITNDEQKRSI